MISFIWPSRETMQAGTGGSETYTAGQTRELVRRGIKAQIVIIGSGVKQSRRDFPDIPFLGLNHEKEISDLPGTVIFIHRAYDVPTRNKAVIIFHCPVPSMIERQARLHDVAGKIIIATSVYSAQQWALYLGVPSRQVNVVMPFADPLFSNVHRANPGKKVRVLYAGRLHSEKGIYTIFEMMQHYEMPLLDVRMSIVMAGQQFNEGRILSRMLKGYKQATLLKPEKSVAGMAALLARTDILLVPSVVAESFGMLSVEAQHSGCRVVASNLGGLPETNCGLLTLVEARNPRALIGAISEAIALGLSTTKERRDAVHEFTLQKSVDSLLSCLPSSHATARS